MRYISGWVESSVLSLKGEGLFVYWGKYIKITGFYIVKDKDYHNLLDTFLYYSNIDIVNFFNKI